MTYEITYPKYAHPHSEPEDDLTGQDVVVADETDIGEKVSYLASKMRKGDFLIVMKEYR